MPVEIRLPKLGLTMEEGTVDEWLVEDGAVVTLGIPLLRLATDKIDVDVEAEAEGILVRAVANGATLPPGAVLGWLLADGEVAPSAAAANSPAPASAGDASTTAAAPAAASAPAPAGHDGERAFVSPNARRVATELGVDVAQVVGTGPAGRVVSEDVEEAAERGPAAGDSAERDSAERDSAEPGVPGRTASPLVRRDARDAGVDVASIATPTGYVSRGDVRAAMSAPAAAAAATVAVPAAREDSDGGQETTSVIALKGMRGTIAARMIASLTEMAQLTHGFEVGMDAVVGLRAQMKEQYGSLGLPVPSLNDFVVRAAALALRQHPILNATIADGEIHTLGRIHLGLAVSVPGGLMVPVIRDADRLSLPELARTTRDLAQRCRDGGIGLGELTGGTFAVTSLGTYGVDMFTPVINPGNVGILGVGRLRDSGRWDGDTWVRTQVLTLSLTFDHRAVDGAPAAEYLQTVSELLARPLLLVS